MIGVVLETRSLCGIVETASIWLPAVHARLRREGYRNGSAVQA